MVDFSAVRGGNAYDSDGDKVGSVDEVYTDKETGDPSFVTVNTGLFGSKTTFVPLADATVDGEDVRLPYDKAKIKGAPSIDPDAEITDEEQERLYEYYGLGGGTSSTGTDGDRDGLRDGDRDRVGGDARDAGTVTAGGTALSDVGRDDRDGLLDGDRDRDDRDGDRDGLLDGDRNDGDRGGLLGGDRDRDGNQHGTVGHDTSGPTTDDAMTRSEERLRVGTRTEETGRARMRKYVTTERVSEDVPVSHEEVRVTREPITDANRGDAHDGPSISEEEHEVTLHAERAVADKETVAVERVRLDTETVQGTERVSDEVREEHIEVDGDGDDTQRGGDRLGNDGLGRDDNGRDRV